MWKILEQDQEQIRAWCHRVTKGPWPEARPSSMAPCPPWGWDGPGPAEGTSWAPHLAAWGGGL